MKKPNFAAMNPEVAKAIGRKMAEQGENFSLEKINLAELARRTGLSRQKLRRMKQHNFEDTQHASKGKKASTTLLSGYTGILGELLRSGVTNLHSAVENGRWYADQRPFSTAECKMAGKSRNRAGSSLKTSCVCNRLMV